MRELGWLLHLGHALVSPVSGGPCTWEPQCVFPFGGVVWRPQGVVASSAAALALESISSSFCCSRSGTWGPVASLCSHLQGWSLFLPCPHHPRSVHPSLCHIIGMLTASLPGFFLEQLGSLHVAWAPRLFLVHLLATGPRLCNPHGLFSHRFMPFLHPVSSCCLWPSAPFC